MPSETRQILRFGGFELHPAERRLVSAGRPVTIGPRAFDLLGALVNRPGQLVTKEELFARVWPRLIVEENNLQVQVSALRKILGAQAIETVPGIGYRFGLEVETVDATPAVRRDNLPAQLDSFVGRERDIAEIRARLQASPLVTIVGVGGLGKTRLALAVGTGMLGEFPDGVWLIDLAPIANAATIPQALAATFDIPENPQRSTVEGITDHLAGRRLLLVLDNCEHVLAGCADLAKQLLDRARNLQILATSREPLHLYGEVVYGLDPLALPETSSTTMPEVSASASARLLIDRARAVNPSLPISDRDVPALVEICRRLDGIPLALELAAARVRVLSLAAIALRIAGRFALLKRGDSTAQPRQQTLRAMMDWSYEFLTPGERVLLARFAVFAGGCSLEQVEEVAAGGPIAADDVLELLGHLVEKSLVVHGEAGRYRLLETVREYALERLAESGEEADVRDRHLAHYLALAQRAEPELRGSDPHPWTKHLNRERENLLSAHAWCGHAGRTEDGLLLLDALRMWLYRTSLELGRRLAEEALAWPGAQARTRGRCLGAYVAATFAYFTGRPDETDAYAKEALSIAREIGDATKIVDALVVRGFARMDAGDYATAREALVEALARARELKDIGRLTDALCCLAELHTANQEPELAIPMYEETLALARPLGSTHSIGINACNLARNRIVCGTREGIEPLLRETLSLLDPALPEQMLQQLLTVCAGLAAFDENWEQAARLYGAAESDLARRGALREVADRLFLDPFIARTRERLGDTAFGAAEKAGRALDCPESFVEIEALLSLRP